MGWCTSADMANVHLLFMIFQKYRTIFLLIMSLILSLIYLTVIAPSINRPWTIVGFFSLLLIDCALAIYLFIDFIKLTSKKLIISLIGAVYIVYLIALGSLNILNPINLILASLIAAVIIFMVVRSKL